MAITVTPIYQFQDITQVGGRLRYAKLRVTGLAAGNNTVPHGLSTELGVKETPIQVSIEPKTISTSSGSASFFEYQDADSTNVYLNAFGQNGVAAPYSCELYVTY